MRTLGKDFPHLIFGEGGDVHLRQFLKEEFVTEPPRGLAGALLLAAQNSKVHLRMLQ